MILKYALIAWVALGAFITILNIGKARRASTSGEAAFVVALDVAVIVAILLWYRA